jgi:hypothetical protein
VDSTAPNPDPIPELMRQLDTLVDGESASAKLAASGPRAVGPLADFLLRGRARSVPWPRCWAVRALGGLGARDVLIEYLEQEPARDPVVRLHEEAVQREAALALTSWDTDDVFAVLMQVARRQAIPGVIEALGRFDRREAVPALLKALEDDCCRPWAETALEAHLARDHDLIVQSAFDRRTDAAQEEKRPSLRRRRAVLRLLRSHAEPPDVVHALAPLIDSADLEIAVDACAIALAGGTTEERARAGGRLKAIEPDAPWDLYADVKALLSHVDSVRLETLASCRHVADK